MCFLKVRAMVSDFAVFIAICAMVFLDFLIGLDTDKLLVPLKFQVHHQFLYGMEADLKLRNFSFSQLLYFIFIHERERIPADPQPDLSHLPFVLITSSIPI